MTQKMLMFMSLVLSCSFFGCGYVEVGILPAQHPDEPFGDFYREHSRMPN
jgi:hypothetical protein